MLGWKNGGLFVYVGGGWKSMFSACGFCPQCHTECFLSFRRNRCAPSLCRCCVRSWFLPMRSLWSSYFMPILFLSSFLWFCWFMSWESNLFCRQVLIFLFGFSFCGAGGAPCYVEQGTTLCWMICLSFPSDPCGSKVLEGTDALPGTSPHAYKRSLPCIWHRHSKFVSIGWLHSVGPMPTKTRWFAGGLLVKPLVPSSTSAPHRHPIPYKNGTVVVTIHISSHKSIH